MIKEQKVIVDINSRNISYYRNMGYDLEMKNFSDKNKIANPNTSINLEYKFFMSYYFFNCFHKNYSILFPKA